MFIMKLKMWVCMVICLLRIFNLSVNLRILHFLRKTPRCMNLIGLVDRIQIYCNFISGNMRNCIKKLTRVHGYTKKYAKRYGLKVQLLNNYLNKMNFPLCTTYVLSRIKLTLLLTIYIWNDRLFSLCSIK